MRTIRPLTLLGLVVLTLALAAATPARPAQATGMATPTEIIIRAWNLRGDFTGGGPYVVLTTYEASIVPPNTPVILWSNQTEIVCVEEGPGAIDYTNSQATFAGNVALRCDLPPALLQGFDADSCEANTEYSYFYFNFEGKLLNAAQSNPIISAADQSFRFGLPHNGTNPRTRAQLGTVVYSSPLWTRNSAGNEVLIGQYGDLMIEASNKIPLLLEQMASPWQPFFDNVTAAEVGNHVTPTSGITAANTQTWEIGADPLAYHTPPPAVYFGRDATSAVNFNGKLAYAEVDPPGCVVK